MRRWASLTCAVNARSSGRDWTPRLPSRLDQPVQHVDGGPRVGQRAVVRLGRGAEERGQRGELAVGHLVARQHPAGEDRGVDDREAGPRRPRAWQASRRNPTSNGALCATSTLPRGELEEGRAAPRAIDGAPQTIASVMPVSTLTNGVIADARVDEGLKLAEHLAAATP